MAAGLVLSDLEGSACFPVALCRLAFHPLALVLLAPASSSRSGEGPVPALPPPCQDTAVNKVHLRQVSRRQDGMRAACKASWSAARASSLHEPIVPPLDDRSVAALLAGGSKLLRVAGTPLEDQREREQAAGLHV